jgi:hypothetical protein
MVIARRSAAVSEEDRRKAEERRKKILERLASHEGEGLSEEEVRWLKEKEREDESKRERELGKERRTFYI